jgi:hypothetical protein
MESKPRSTRTRVTGSLVLGCALALLAASCGLAESVVEDFVDDQDYELFASEGSIGTLTREVSGIDVGLRQGVLRPGDTAAGHQALGVLGFGFDRDLQPDKTRLEWIRLRFWIQTGSGDVSGLGPLVVSHIPNADSVLGTGLVPDPPGDDVATISDVTSVGWREVDVSQEFLAAWNANRQLAAFVIRFATPTDGEDDDDDVDLFPEVDGVVRRAHLVLHFGVDL